MNKNIFQVTTLLFYIFLLFMQFSCTTVKEYKVPETQAVADKKAPDVRLLADKHKESGIECSSCHGESDTKNRVPETVCRQCHGDYKEAAASYLDPHNAHHTSTDCGVCHHVHKPSEKICQGCHSFNMQAP